MGYRKMTFDKCLVALVSELERVEEKYPDWPENMTDAAKIISKKAGGLLSASTDLSSGNQMNHEHVVGKAIETGAMVLRFLLSMETGFSYAVERIDDSINSGFEDLNLKKPK